MYLSLLRMLNLSDLKFARTLSFRNGFGPVPIPPPVPFEEITNEQKWFVLHNALNDLTGAEEAAIRQISPLISIVSLKNGNIASRGNTSCVYQKSKLSRILPNLPSECSYIVIRRRQRSKTNNTNYSLKETKFKKTKMLGVLILLQQTCEPWTDIIVSQNRLDQWPDDGDLVNLNEHVVTITEEEVEAQSESSDGGVEPTLQSTTDVELNANGDDLGPAPLQNDVVPDETYEGIVNVGEGNVA